MMDLLCHLFIAKLHAAENPLAGLPIPQQDQVSVIQESSSAVGVAQQENVQGGCCLETQITCLECMIKVCGYCHIEKDRWIKIRGYILGLGASISILGSFGTVISLHYLNCAIPFWVFIPMIPCGIFTTLTSLLDDPCACYACHTRMNQILEELKKTKSCVTPRQMS